MCDLNTQHKLDTTNILYTLDNLHNIYIIRIHYNNDIYYTNYIHTI